MKIIFCMLTVLTFFGGNYGDQPKRALLIIDVQKCFIRGGNLAVASGEDVVPIINEIRRKYETKFQSVYASLDYHPPNHISFASQHVGKQLYEAVTLNYNSQGELCSPTTLKNETCRVIECDHVDVTINQKLWPDHCIIGTEEADFAPGLFIDILKDKIILKGTKSSIDSYSAFYDNANLSETDLHHMLQNDNIEELFIVGIATDYCVRYTSLDGIFLGYKVYLVKDATRYVSGVTYRQALNEMYLKGVHIINTTELEDILGMAEIDNESE